MKKIFRLLFCCMTVIAVTTACADNPIDEDGLLITDRDECYVSNFDLTGTDHLTVKIGDAIILLPVEYSHIVAPDDKFIAYITPFSPAI